MPLNTISLRRPLTSYAKVRMWIGAMVRNRGFQLRRPRVLAAKYLDVGCGPNTHKGFINLDYLWHPGVDVCWDLRRGLPFADCSMQGVFSEHCLEHFPMSDALPLLRDIRRVLTPGGIARIVVPDGGLYLRLYAQHFDGIPDVRFPYQECDPRDGIWTPMLSVNRIFYQDRESLFGHRIIYDFQLLRLLLQEAGFTHIVRRDFLTGADKRLLVDTPARRVESLYVEASP